MVEVTEEKPTYICRGWLQKTESPRITLPGSPMLSDRATQINTAQHRHRAPEIPTALLRCYTSASPPQGKKKYHGDFGDYLGIAAKPPETLSKIIRKAEASVRHAGRASGLAKLSPPKATRD